MNGKKNPSSLLSDPFCVKYGEPFEAVKRNFPLGILDDFNCIAEGREKSCKTLCPDGIASSTGIEATPKMMNKLNKLNLMTRKLTRFGNISVYVDFSLRMKWDSVKPDVRV